ncbi:GbsR/MarR family transcriptional regulator [Aurantiacibacter sp. D1-12]|uniref:GbsR/MarR family transcriptional regulator n=1 Tax=Aurantiacibacter sp. D1-12 TaxID=2993658 RepID=UPI00237C62D3|nr:MarR family transcriptional regulator [Aurantiacibacter sp. D1-12]MDE1468524.1 MarR family transcriptional regulator [Aurantiacibacter sp. D1-12]
MTKVIDIPEARDFILHWGEMGSHWGVNRSVSQVHALLYLSEDPLHAEEICETLGLARSNVSTALKELQGYGIVRRTHVIGDRRDHFLAETDLWDMLMKIVVERKKREIDPTIQTLSDLTDQMAKRDDVPKHVRERIGRMHDFMGTLSGWYDDVRRLPKSTLVALMKLGGKVARFVPTRSQTKH